MKKLNICIVEDEEILRETLKDDLTDAGYSVIAFDNPVNSLEYITKNKVDVVFSDIRLPQMNGLDLLSKIKFAKPDTFVVMMNSVGVKLLVKINGRRWYIFLTAVADMKITKNPLKMEN